MEHVILSCLMAFILCLFVIGPFVIILDNLYDNSNLVVKENNFIERYSKKERFLVVLYFFLLFVGIGYYIFDYGQFDIVISRIGLFLYVILLLFIIAYELIKLKSVFILNSFLKIAIKILIGSLILYLLFCSFYALYYDWFVNQIEDIFFGTKSIVVLIGCIGFSAFFYRIVFFHGLFAYKNRRYILLLRPFSFDCQKDTIKDSLNYFSSITNFPVLAIADPRVVFSGYSEGNVDFFSLPTLNWKKQLKHYIQRAEWVITVLDVTSGVFWEVFEHLEYINKYVYYIKDRDTISNVLHDVKIQKYSSQALTSCFKKLESAEDIDGYAIYICNNRCYYAPLNDMLCALADKSLIEYLDSFIVPTFSLCKDENRKKHKRWLDIIDVSWYLQKGIKYQLFGFTGLATVILIIGALIIPVFCYSSSFLYSYMLATEMLKSDFHIYNLDYTSAIFGCILMVWIADNCTIYADNDYYENKQETLFRLSGRVRLFIGWMPLLIGTLALFLSYCYCLIIGDMSIFEIWGRLVALFFAIKLQSAVICEKWNLTKKES